METGQVDEAEEVLDVVFPSVTKRRKLWIQAKSRSTFQPFSIAAELAAILSSAFAPASIRRDQFDAVLFSEVRVERVRVIGFVTDQPGWEFVEKASGKNLFNKRAIVPPMFPIPMMPIFISCTCLRGCG